MTEDEKLRRWCLVQALARCDAPEMAGFRVTDIAQDYYDWIKSGGKKPEKSAADYQQAVSNQQAFNVYGMNLAAQNG